MEVVGQARIRGIDTDQVALRFGTTEEQSWVSRFQFSVALNMHGRRREGVADLTKSGKRSTGRRRIIGGVHRRHLQTARLNHHDWSCHAEFRFLLHEFSHTDFRG